jgi:hexosaminidase
MKKITLILLLLLFSPIAPVNAMDQNINIIPYPQELKVNSGNFVLTPTTVIYFDSDEDKSALIARHLQNTLKPATGYPLKISKFDPDTQKSNYLLLTTKNAQEFLGSEGYMLEVTPQQIIVKAPQPSGLFYGIQTLRQLLPPEILKNSPSPDITWKIPAVEIKDFPRFPWRGLMLDCSRTFQSLDYIKKTIERMALYKMNVLHLHLTDDQGWRLEIKRYPELTQTGARFPEKYHEPPAHQGFYSQKEMKELVEYAASRNIIIVPEIELPGHSLSALSCYPHLSCTGGPFEIYPFFKGPNITQEIYCAGNEETFEFLTNILSEVFEIFPSKYIHIGGDEAPKSRWQQCPKCQARIKAEDLKDEHELQSYFIKRIEKYVNSQGRQIIGWDEILEGGLAPNAAVMSWRGIKGGIAATQAQHSVVMSPTSHCYFDYKYEAIDSKKAYLFEPVPQQLTESQGRYILGLQANFWSHIDREPQKVDYQLFPRLLSLAERGWSPRELRDWEKFHLRLQHHLPRLEILGINYRRSPKDKP